MREMLLPSITDDRNNWMPVPYFMNIDNILVSEFIYRIDGVVYTERSEEMIKAWKNQKSGKN